MNKQELDDLIGLTTNEASKIVEQNNLKPRIYKEDAILPAITIPPDVVRIFHDENLIVVGAETQQSIDDENP